MPSVTLVGTSAAADSRAAGSAAADSAASDVDAAAALSVDADAADVEPAQPPGTTVPVNASTPTTETGTSMVHVSPSHARGLANAEPRLRSSSCVISLQELTRTAPGPGLTHSRH
jgi:hypothetical protein